MKLHKGNPLYLHIFKYIIISALLSHNTNGFSKNNSYKKTSIDNFYLFHQINKSYVIHPPISLCEQSTSPKYVALGTFSGMVMVVGLIGNLMVILVIQYSQLCKQSGYVLIKSLAAADLGVSLFVTTVKVYIYQQNGNFCSGISLCVFHHLTDGLFPTASITHLLLIALNKFCAVHIPYRYHVVATYSRENVVVLCIWFYCFLWSAAGMFTWDENPLFSLDVISTGIARHCYSINNEYYVCAAICVFIIPVIVAGSLYGVLLYTIIEKMNSTPVPIGNTGALQKNDIRPRYGNMKGAKTLMMVFTGWVVCWVPHFLLILVGYWNPYVLHSFTESHVELSDFISTVLSDVLPCLNSCVNPIIYFITSSMFRHSLRDSYLKLMKKPRHRAGSNSVYNQRSTMILSRQRVIYRSGVSRVLLPNFQQ